MRESRDVLTLYLKTHNAEQALSQLESLLAQAQTPEVARAKTLLSLLRATVTAEKSFAAPISLTRSPLSFAKLFDGPFALAKESNDGPLQAKVLADECIFFLDNGTLDGNELETVRKLLQVAASCSESEPDLLVAAAVFFDKAMPVSSSRRMLDQALVLDPANWRGLVERYQIARKEAKTAETHQLLELIHHYYPGCNPPATESQPVKSTAVKPPLKATTSAAASN
jgi:hypothetical protein